jgi:hypothetical protein
MGVGCVMSSKLLICVPMILGFVVTMPLIIGASSAVWNILFELVASIKLKLVSTGFLGEGNKVYNPISI